mmetsp:Transcript_36471/g.101229  ORF Transcript_36471/g.101229 Transcript_36471/m.101229 type:complete len:218 (-) Transcript_36471:328-981(-)
MPKGRRAVRETAPQGFVWPSVGSCEGVWASCARGLKAGDPGCHPVTHRPSAEPGAACRAALGGLGRLHAANVGESCSGNGLHPRHLLGAGPGRLAATGLPGVGRQRAAPARPQPGVGPGSCREAGLRGRGVRPAAGRRALACKAGNPAAGGPAGSRWQWPTASPGAGSGGQGAGPGQWGGGPWLPPSGPRAHRAVADQRSARRPAACAGRAAGLAGA